MQEGSQHLGAFYFAYCPRFARGLGVRLVRRGRRVALSPWGAPFQPLGVGRLVCLARVGKHCARGPWCFPTRAGQAPSRGCPCTCRVAPGAGAPTRPPAAKGAPRVSSAVAPAAPQKSGVRSGRCPQRAFLSARALCCPGRKVCSCAYCPRIARGFGVRLVRRGRRVALSPWGAPFQPLGVGRLVCLARVGKHCARGPWCFPTRAGQAPSRGCPCTCRVAPGAGAPTRPPAAKGAPRVSSAVAPAAPQKSGVRSGRCPQRAFLSARAYRCPVARSRAFWSCLRCHSSTNVYSVLVFPHYRAFYYSGGGGFASYVRGADCRGVLRAGAPSPRSCGSGGPRPFSPSPLPLVAPPRGLGGSGRVVSSSAGLSFRLTPCACFRRLQAQGSRANWRYFKIVLHRLSNYPLSFDIRRCKRFQNTDAPPLMVAPAPFWSFLRRALRAAPTHHPYISDHVVWRSAHQAHPPPF